MADTPRTAGAEIILAAGLVAIPTEVLRELAATEANARGIVLANDRAKFYILHDDNGTPKPVLYTASLYVQREPLTDTEAADITKNAAERDKRKLEKQEAERTQKERDVKAALQVGQESIMSAMRNLSTLTQAAHVLSAVGK